MPRLKHGYLPPHDTDRDPASWPRWAKDARVIPILILAAGGSTRMRGGDKLMEYVDGMPLLRRQTLRAIETGYPVYVALPSADHPRRVALDGLAAIQLIVPEAAEGMSGTMRGAVHQLPEFAGFMILLADLIDIDTQDICAVLRARDTKPDYLIWRGATAAGKPGHPVIFDGSLRPKFAEIKGDTGGEAVAKPLSDRSYLVPLPGTHARNDLDTPEDWAAWRQSNPTY